MIPTPQRFVSLEKLDIVHLALVRYRALRVRCAFPPRWTICRTGPLHSVTNDAQNPTTARFRPRKRVRVPVEDRSKRFRRPSLMLVRRIHGCPPLHKPLMQDFCWIDSYSLPDSREMFFVSGAIAKSNEVKRHAFGATWRWTLNRDCDQVSLWKL